MILKELIAIIMEKKEKVKDFNHCFITLLYNNLVDAMAIEYYTSTRVSSITIFIISARKNTLTENFNEALIMEKEMLSPTGNTTKEDLKANGKKSLLLMKPIQKEATNLDNELHIVKKNSNK